MNLTAAMKVIKRAEEELRTQAQRALAEGRYADVGAIVRLTDGLAQLLSRGLSNGTPTVAFTEVMVSPSIDSSATSPPRLIGRTKRSAKRFPRFEREGDQLVKVAWSKRHRSEYEHKAPFRMVNLLIEAIRSRKGEASKFTAPDVLPLVDPKTRKEIPSYKSYLALAWLRHEGVVVKYGRDTYSMKPTAATTAHITELWEALPSRD